MSGYLDEEGTGTTSSLLLAHLQQQSYHQRISPTGRQSTERGRAGQRVVEESEEDDDDDVDQLSITTWDSEEEEKRAQEEWEESMMQFNLAIQVMLLPFVGKWLGRKWSYWGE
jgi:hypothetical protein